MNVLEEINRQASVKKVKELVDTTQKEYISADAKARVQEDTMRKVNQKQADMAMDVSSRILKGTNGSDKKHGSS